MPARAWRTVPCLSVVLLLTLWPLAGGRAQQAERPLPLPTADVMVAYRFDGVPPGTPRRMQLTYEKAGERVRIDYFRWFEAKYPYLTLIYDRPADRLISIQPERKAYIDRPIGNNINPGELLPPQMLFTRQGTSTVAFAQCTVWRLNAPGEADDGATACVTDDGIVLRLAHTKPTLTTLTATTIHYGAPPPGVFDAPQGFKREQE
jgi:hypothetical protein